MSYIQANDLNTIEEEINKFQSSNFNIKNNTHIVIQTLSIFTQTILIFKK